LVDQYGRHIQYLRLSVTDRCDLRCNYCMPRGFKDFAEPDEWLSFDEIARLVGLFGEMGVRHIRLTGGEPLVRRDIDQLVSMISTLPGITDLSMSTNAVRLKDYAQGLKLAGLKRLNVSLDTLDPERYASITGGGKLEKVLAGLDAAREAGIGPIKINCVLMKDVNDDQIPAILEYCAERAFTLRLIETMPVGDTGRALQARYVNLETIKQQLSEQYELVPDIMPGAGPARYYRIQGSSSKIGFITPISRHFCDTCNRVRLSCEGNIYTCLGDESRYTLAHYLRSDCSDNELEQHIRSAINLKPLKHDFNGDTQKVVRFMSMTGG
jgi:GTP 3',8-cyclase